MNAESRFDSILDKLRCEICGGAAQVRQGALACGQGHLFEQKPDMVTNAIHLGSLFFYFNKLYEWKAYWLSRLQGVKPSFLDVYLSGREVLDLGCGPYTYYYDPELCKLRLGLDIAHGAAEANAARYPRSIILSRDLGRPLPFKDKSFDYVVLVFVLHHLHEETGAEILKEALRTARLGVILLDHTRSGGFVGLAQKIWWSTFDGGFIYRTEPQWELFLRGLKILEYQRFGRVKGNANFYLLEPGRS